jgi:glycosyltransferase involved in cell wall biosynthesis
MKVVHVGNVANIAYLNTKFLRRLGMEVDLYYYDFDLCLAQPEWEDAQIEGTIDLGDPDWRKKVVLNNYEPPFWAHPINMTVRRGALTVKIPFASAHGSRLERFLYKWQYRANRLIPIWQQYQIIRRSLARRQLNISLTLKDSIFYFDIYRFREIVQDYDLVQAYGLEPISCLVDFPQKPYIAYEFGTMREIPFEGSLRGQLLAAAYQQANRVIITNPDVRPLAEKLGLRNYVFIPHPIDEEKFCPGPSKIRDKLEAQFGKDVIILFAPARHDWALKGTDKMIRAVARLTREQRSLTMLLMLITWGQDVQRSKSLIAQEGIEKQVLWLPLLPKMQMVEYYRAADIVLDQFNIGTFGLTTPEAMACGKPVVVYFEPQIHQWCFSEMPPIIEAQTEEEIYEEVKELFQDPSRRKCLGEQSRAWVIQHHGWRRVAEEHIRLYREIVKE